MAHSTESSRMNKTSLRWTKIDTPFYILFEANKLLNRERKRWQNIWNTIFGEIAARLRGIVSPKCLIERDRLKSR